MATISQRALAKSQAPEGEQEFVTIRLPVSRKSPKSGKDLPILNIRNLVEKKGNKETWITIGGLWLAKMQDGSYGFTLRISNFAPTFLSSGDALCMIPLPPRKEGEEQEQSE